MDASSSNDRVAIWLYILSNHVFSITAYSPDDVWSANLFYAADYLNDCVYVMTSTRTRHGEIMIKQPQVSGTICLPTENIAELKGIQFNGVAQLLSEAEYASAFETYQQRFPVAKKMQETLWKISFKILKYTDNSRGFGTKLIWQQ